MKDNGWIKHFITGSPITGLDRDVPSGKCSWSRSRLSGMLGCELHHEGKVIQISGDGNYHQSDDLKALFAPGETVESEFITRRLQYHIRDCDTHVSASCDEKSLHLFIGTPPDGGTPSDWVQLQKEDIGMWLTVELDVETERINWSIKEKI